MPCALHWTSIRQQSFARRAEIKGSCISNILLSVLLCTTLKPNEKFSGNSVIGFNKDRKGIHKVDLLSQLSHYLYLLVLNSTKSSGNNWKFH